MLQRRKVGLRAVLLLAALYYLVALPVGYVYAADWLGCCRLDCCGGGGVKTTPLIAARSAVMLYLADNPRRCPTLEELVDERYLDKAYTPGIEIRCKDGEAEVIGPAPPAPTLRMRWERQACRTLNLGGTVWALPFRGLIWAWQAAARAFF